MELLGSNRDIIKDYYQHGYAEDYTGNHLSKIIINGTAKVIKIVNKYKPYEDSVDYNDFLQNKSTWKDGLYFNCISITGKLSRYHQSELGGNQLELECYEGSEKRYFKFLHLAEVLVKEGDIINGETIIGRQGNTGLVLSYKDRNDTTYGSHVHFEVRDENYISINPREYALLNIKVDYVEQSNEVDDSKRQFKVLTDKINIKTEPNLQAKEVGSIYKDEIYNVLETFEDDIFIWYKIKTNREANGFVANEKNKKLLEITEPSVQLMSSNKESINDNQVRLIFKCPKDGLYAIKLKNGEQLYIK